jgi:flagellar biosynthetic protein FliQ
MDASQVIELGRESLWVAVMVASPLLGVALATGLIIGIFQAATSIQEMTLSFIPKLGVMVIALMAFGSWQIGIMIDFFGEYSNESPCCLCDGFINCRYSRALLYAFMANDPYLCISTLGSIFFHQSGIGKD